MNFGIMIEIKDIAGNVRFSTQINVGAKGRFSLMKDDCIILPFSVTEPIAFSMGDYADLSGVLDESLGGRLSKIYEITESQKPVRNKENGGYDYNLRLDAYYIKWKNKIFKYLPEGHSQEASWSLTASLSVHLDVFLRNLSALKYKYRGSNFQYSIDATVSTKAFSLTYSNTNMLDALTMMAEALECEWWVTDNVIHFGRCEFGSPVKIELFKEASDMTRSESKGMFATRIYAFGSEKNIPTNYRPTSEGVVVNGIVQRRLMLPEGTPYLDAYPNMTEEEAIEAVVTFDVFPHRVGTISNVTTYKSTVENDDGSKTTATFYRYRDAELNFSKEYILEGQELKITFESGLMNGMTFGVAFNPTGKDDKQWEIIQNEDYGRALPDDVILPKAGDKYVLSGYDTKFVSVDMLPQAENELLEKATEYLERTKRDDSTYTVSLNSVWVEEDKVHRTFDVGQQANLVNNAYFQNGRISRVIGWEFNLDIPYDTPTYVIGESPAYSRLGNLEEKLDELTYKGQTFGGNGGGIYVIRTNDGAAASDSNVFSALRSLAMFLRKDKSDQTDYLMRFGEFFDSMTGGKGTGIFPNGRIQTDRIEVRGSMTVLDLIINELHGMAGDYAFSDSGKIDRVEHVMSGTYKLWMHKELEDDITNFEDDDVMYSIVNNLRLGGTDYYTSWFRPIKNSKNIVENSLVVTLYPDSEVPGGKNYPPLAGYNVTRRGNAVLTEGGTNKRSQSWLLSSSEGRIMFLQNVFKPILEDYNYALTLGKLPNLKVIDELGLTGNVGLYAETIVTEKLYRVDWNGDVVPNVVDRGEWSRTVAESEDKPYRFIEKSKEYPDGTKYTQLEQHTAYHYGCKWGCLKDKTKVEPAWNCAEWNLLEGDINFHLDFESSNGWQFFVNNVDTVINAVVSYGNQDITPQLLTTPGSSFRWSRETGNVAADETWALNHSNVKNELHITHEDMGTGWGTEYRKISFVCIVSIPGSKESKFVENRINIKI